MMKFLSVKLEVYSFRLQLCYKENSPQIFFGKMYRKVGVLKKRKKVLFLRKKSVVDQRLNKAAAL